MPRQSSTIVTVSRPLSTSEVQKPSAPSSTAAPTSAAAVLSRIAMPCSCPSEISRVAAKTMLAVVSPRFPTSAITDATSSARKNTPRFSGPSPRETITLISSAETAIAMSARSPMKVPRAMLTRAFWSAPPSSSTQVACPTRMTRVLHILPHEGGGGEALVDLLGRLDGFEHERIHLSSARSPLRAAPSIARGRRAAPIAAPGRPTCCTWWATPRR